MLFKYYREGLECVYCNDSKSQHILSILLHLAVYQGQCHKRGYTRYFTANLALASAVHGDNIVSLTLSTAVNEDGIK